jgi:hypothetical protein
MGKLRIKIEVTDTFGGEANYSWVNRHELLAHESITDLQIMRLVKKEIGWTGLKTTKYNYGDTIEIRPKDICQVCFINFESEQNG